MKMLQLLEINELLSYYDLISLLEEMTCFDTK